MPYVDTEDATRRIHVLAHDARDAWLDGDRDGAIDALDYMVRIARTLPENERIVRTLSVALEAAQTADYLDCAFDAYESALCELTRWPRLPTKVQPFKTCHF